MVLRPYYIASLAAIFIVVAATKLFAHPSQCTSLDKTYHVASLAIFSALILEFSLDRFIQFISGSLQKGFSDSTGHTIEHPFGHGLIIVSLFPTSLILFLPSESFSLLDVYLLLVVGEACAFCGVLGKIQTFCTERWCRMTAFISLMLFVSSQMIPIVSPLDQYRYTSAIFELPDTISLTCALLFALIVLVAWKSTPCFKTLIELSNNAIDIFLRREFLSAVLSVVTCLHLFIQIFMTLHSRDNLQNLILYKVLAQIGFVFSAAILPGRVLRRGLLALKREMEYKKTFVRYISHEVRSPLSTMAMGLQCLQSSLSELSNYNDTLRSARRNSSPSSKPPAEQLAASLDMGSSMASVDNYSTEDSLTPLDHIAEELTSTTEDCQQACEVAIHTLDDLLLYDKIECKMVTIETKLMSIYDVVYCTVKPFHMIASAKDVSLNLDLPRGLRCFLVEIDKHKITQVVRNLISNALKFTPSQGKIRISMSMVRHGKEDKGLGGVRIEVQDSGTGISPENAKELFGQYVQFDANKLQRGGGSGLGLWISKAIVEMHGGSIGAHSEGEGKGCTFFFELPIKEVEKKVRKGGGSKLQPPLRSFSRSASND